MSPDDTGRTGRSGEFRDQDGRTLPERIRQRRKARGLKSLELARALQVSPSYVTMIERGKKVPSEDVALAIAAFLGDDPELYRAWVHSTRFTDPTSTLRGLQRLYYSGPTSPSPTWRNARIQSASQRARLRWTTVASPASVQDEEPDESIDFLVARRIPRGTLGFEDEIAASPAPAFSIPLIALGRATDRRLRFWRMPWAVLDHDPRPLRFVVAPSGQTDTLLVATPEEFVEIVMDERGADLMQSPDWFGWQSPDPEGGVVEQPLDLRGKLAPLLRDRAAFLESLGDSVDVIVQQGTRVDIRRLSPGELAALLDQPSL